MTSTVSAVASVRVAEAGVIWTSAVSDDRAVNGSRRIYEEAARLAEQTLRRRGKPIFKALWVHDSEQTREPVWFPGPL